MADKQETTETVSSPVKKSPKKSKAPKKPSHARRKRPPKRLSQKPNDVYINRSSQFSGQLARCHKLFDQGFNDVTIHGLGAAIHRAINLALQLKQGASFPMDLHTTTSTVELVDDMEPLNDDVDYQTQSRPNSAIHVRLSRISTPSQPTHTSHSTKHTDDKDSKITSSTEHDSGVSDKSKSKGYSTRTL